MDSEGWDKRYAESELVWSAGPNTFVEAFAASLTPGTALDLGSGEGRNAIWLAEKGWDVTAVDFSAVGVEKGAAIAQRRNADVTWVVSDLLDFQPQQDFDFVLLAYIQLPKNQLAQVLKMAANAVAPGGSLFVVGHDSSNLLEGYGGPQTPEVLFTPEDVVRNLDGLHVARAEKVDRTVQTPDGERTAIDALVIAERTK